MNSLFLELTLLEEVSLSASNATLGGHRTLRQIPGACLLGALANSYKSFSPELQWILFHSGQVRFGDALPATEGGIPALPMPLCFHYAKGKEPFRKKDGWHVQSFQNLARQSRSDAFGKTQAEQLRGGFWSSTQRLMPKTRYSLRTAISTTGRAKEAFLFGLESLLPQQRFLARIDVDDASLIEKIRPYFVGKTLYMGRSRSAEFGRVQIQEARAWDFTTPLPKILNRIVLLCISPLCLRDLQTGAPSLTPAPEHFGLPSTWKLDLKHSFLRTESYTPFNGFRKKPDLERQLIVAGSVLVFEGSGFDSAGMLKALARGVGDYRQDGLGQILAEPALLAQKQYNQVAEPPKESPSVTPPSLPHDALGGWLARAIGRRDNENRVLELAKSWRAAMKDYGLPASQWGEVRRIATRAVGLVDAPSRLNSDLKKFIGSGVGKLENRWGKKRGGKMAGDCLLDLIKLESEKQPSERCDVALVTELLATLVVRKES